MLAFGGQGVAAEFVVAGDTPDIRLHAILLSENGLRANDLVQDRTTAKELRDSLTLRRCLELVDAADDAFPDRVAVGFRQLWHRIVFVVHGDVVEAVFALLVHAAESVLQDDSELIDIGRVVADAGGDGAREDVAVAVLVLQSFA